MTTEQPRIPRTLRYEPGALILLDQRRLPARREEVRCTTAEDVEAAIREMAVRGAPAIGVAAAYGIALAARSATETSRDASAVVAAVDAGAERLIAARPTAVNLGNAVRRLRDDVRQAAASGISAGALVTRVEGSAAALERFELEASYAMGRLTADLLPDRARVLVHCNAGALATVERGTALAGVYELFERGRLEMVYVSETRPRLQGARLTAFELAETGIPHVLVVDSLAATLMRQGDVSAVLVGADRIAANGDVANKVGTYSLAVACSHHAVPFIVVAPTSSIDRGCETGAEVPIEYRDPDELVVSGGERLAPEVTPVLNPAFDVTPASLIHVLVTERGVIRPVTREGVEQLLTTIPPVAAPG